VPSRPSTTSLGRPRRCPGESASAARAVRHQPKWVFGISRNDCSASPETGVRLRPKLPFAILRNGCSFSAVIHSKRELDHAADDLVAVKPLRRGARLAERRSAAQRPAESRRGHRPGAGPARPLLIDGEGAGARALPAARAARVRSVQCLGIRGGRRAQGRRRPAPVTRQ